MGGFKFSFDSTYTYAFKAREAAIKINYKDGEAKSLLNLGINEWIRKKNYDRAEEYIRQAIDVADTKPVFRGDAYMRLAELLITKTKGLTGGDLVTIKLIQSKRIEAITNAARYYRVGGDRMKEGEPLTWLCMTYVQRGNYSEGFTFCDNALRITRHAKNVWEFELLRWSLLNIKLYNSVGDYETALDYLRQSYQVVKINQLTAPIDSKWETCLTWLGNMTQHFTIFQSLRIILNELNG